MHAVILYKFRVIIINKAAERRNQNHLYLIAIMSQSNLLDTSGAKREVSESAYEYLLGEILNLESPAKVNDQAAAATERLEGIGFDVGYRYLLCGVNNRLNGCMRNFRCCVIE